MTGVLEVDLTKQLGPFTLRARFRADEPATLVLFGPSGSGKSLTLQAIAGLMRPDSGRIAVDDETLFDSRTGVELPPERRRVGYLPQGYALFPHLTVAENIGYGLLGLPRAEARRRIADAVTLLQLEGLEDRRPGQISGGQQQRVALARALVIRPRLLLLDEPFAALDPEIRRTLRSELVELQRRVGIAVVFVTHDLSEAHAVGERVAVYDRGEVLQVGVTEDVFDRPASRRVAELTGTRNILPGRVVEVCRERVRARVGPYELEAPPSEVAPGGSIHLCIRPEHVLLVRDEKAPHHGPRMNVLSGRIVREVKLGTYRTLYFRLDPPILDGPHDLEMDVPEHVYEVMAVGRKPEWRVSLKRSAIHLIPVGDPACDNSL